MPQDVLTNSLLWLLQIIYALWLISKPLLQILYSCCVHAVPVLQPAHLPPARLVLNINVHAQFASEAALLLPTHDG